MSGAAVDEHLRAQLDAIDGDQITAETLAGKDAAIRAAHDLRYWHTLRSNGVGTVAATLLTAIRAATD